AWHGRGRVRGEALFLLRHRHGLLPGGRQAESRAPAVVAHHERHGGQEPRIAHAPHSLSDIGLVESLGGMTRAAESRWAKLQIERCAAEQQARLDAGIEVVVGVNKYPAPEDEPLQN